MATVLISARDIYGFLEPKIEFSLWVSKVIIGKKSFLIKDLLLLKIVQTMLFEL